MAIKVKIFDPAGTQIVQVAKSSITVGSHRHCDVVLSHPSVHGEHLRVWTEGGRVWVQDLEGSNGSQINGSMLPSLKPMLMRELDVLKLGSCPVTLALEVSLVRAPIVRSQPSFGEINQVHDDDRVTEVTDGALEKRRIELENLGREMAEARLQLQMSQLEQATADELGKQIAKMREEIRCLSEQKVQWNKGQQEKFGHERFSELTELTHMWINKKVKPWERQVITEEVILQWESELGRLFRRVLTQDSAATDRRSIERAPGEKYSESVAKRSRKMKRQRFWTRGKIAGLTMTAAMALVVGSLALNPSRARTRMPASQAAATPLNSQSAKTNYTDNVLYTDRYLEIVRNDEFRKQWAEELSRAMAADWKLDQTAAEPVAAKEAQLIEDLAKLKEKLSGADGGEAIVRMRAREMTFQKELADVFKDRLSVDRFLKFKHSFYMRHGRKLRQ